MKEIEVVEIGVDELVPNLIIEVGPRQGSQNGKTDKIEDLGLGSI